MNTRVRNLNIHKLRAQGKSFRSIANEYGISGARVRQICAKIDRERELKHSDKLYALMTLVAGEGERWSAKRIYLALRRRGIEKPDDLLLFDDDSISKIRLIGTKYLDRIKKARSIVEQNAEEWQRNETRRN